MKKINLANRFKNKATLVAVISILALLANQVAGVFGVDYSGQIEQLVTIAGTVLTLLAGLGIIVDPNSKGVSDTGMAMELTAPRDENVNPVEFQENIKQDVRPGEVPVVEEEEGEK